MNSVVPNRPEPGWFRIAKVVPGTSGTGFRLVPKLPYGSPKGNQGDLGTRTGRHRNRFLSEWFPNRNRNHHAARHDSVGCGALGGGRATALAVRARRPS